MEIKLNLKQAGVLAIAAVAALSVQARGGKRLSEYVNPFIGATTNTQMAKAEHGLGKTFPGVASFGVAPEDQGGDGVTLVTFR